MSPNFLWTLWFWTSLQEKCYATPSCKDPFTPQKISSSLIMVHPALIRWRFNYLLFHLDVVPFKERKIYLICNSNFSIFISLTAWHIVDLLMKCLLSLRMSFSNYVFFFLFSIYTFDLQGNSRQKFVSRSRIANGQWLKCKCRWALFIRISFSFFNQPFMIYAPAMSSSKLF